MKAPLIARILGAVFLLAGALAFVPFVVVPAGVSDEYIQIGARYGFVAGLFPVNVVHDAIHLLFGILGVAASFSFGAAVRYCRWVAWIYGLLFILGAIPITNTLFGIVPIYGHDIWLHALIAIFAAYGGYGAAAIPPEPEEALLPPAPG